MHFDLCILEKVYFLYMGDTCTVLPFPWLKFHVFIIAQCVVCSFTVIIPPLDTVTHLGWEAVGAGLQPGQVILKVNGNNVNRSDYQEVLEHFTAHHKPQEPPQAVRKHMKISNTVQSVPQQSRFCCVFIDSILKELQSDSKRISQ